MASNEAQDAIAQKHLENDNPLLKKYDGGRIGSGGFDPQIFSATYELVGLSDSDANTYLPSFEFNVGSGYGIEISGEAMSGETIHHEQDCMRLKLKARDGSGLVGVSFPKVKGLFDLRNLAKNGQLLTIPQVSERDRERLPIDENQVHADFSFRASSTSYGQLFARMGIDHPAAEEVIMAYLGAIDRRFADYSGLEPHFREEDGKGERLWEDQQSRAYKRERKKLDKALFGELTDILKKADLELHQA